MKNPLNLILLAIAIVLTVGALILKNHPRFNHNKIMWLTVAAAISWGIYVTYFKN